MAKIGIYGGTFNPVHNGHLYIARQAKEQLALDEIWWIVSGNPPHKGDAITGRIMRYKMCALALDGQPDMVLKDYEMRQTCQCYTYELLEALHQQYSEHQWYFIMGEDSLIQFSTWKHPKKIAKLASLVVAIRSKAPKSDDMEAAAVRIRDTYHTNVYILDTKNVPVSSTQIRQNVREQISISEMVPDAVEAYITDHELYRKHKNDDLIEKIEKIQGKLQKKLKPKRYEHTVGVMETSANLAMCYCMPINKLRIAGLLHDCAKCYSNQELTAHCKKYGLSITPAEKKSPHLLHAKVGAYLAKNEYHVKDADILQAIRVHTTGSPAMSITSQILFVADYIEPNRDRAKRLSEIRQIAYHDLNLATAMILEDTIEYLKEKQQPMDEATLETYDYYKKLIQSHDNQSSSYP